MNLVYLIGVPGSGKSSVMAAASARFNRVPAEAGVRFDYLLEDSGVVAGVELGVRRASFSGTDAYALNVMPRAVAALPSLLASVPVVLAEGDRLASPRFLDVAGPDLRLVHIDVPEDVAAARRAARGSNQSPSWLAGRRTKVGRLADRYAGHPGFVRLDGTAPVSDLAAAVAAVAGWE